MPHTYPEGEASRWISTHKEQFEINGTIILAIRLNSNDSLLGCENLSIEALDKRGSLGYWLDRSCWGKGYATEAGLEMLDYAFGVLDLNKVSAECFSRNLASASVMMKLGMVHEGHKHGHYGKWGEFLDSEEYGILRSEWERRRREGPD
jgi:RimJ/RimL family protein N-acetyltransferase